MTEPHEPATLERLLDRLVDGELPDAERRAALHRLEAEPDGWRRCALSFLEAQTWREALAPMTATVQPATLPAQQRRRSSRSRAVAGFAALAASLALTFALGWALHRTPGVPSGETPPAQVRNPSMAPAVESRRPELAQQTNPFAPPVPSTGQHAALPDVVKQLEQQGYQAETQTRLVSVKLNDGRKVEVPIHEVRFKYVGDRTY